MEDLESQTRPPWICMFSNGDEQINDGFGEHHQYQSIDNVPTSAERQVRVM
jgi:hypothetical protein